MDRRPFTRIRVSLQYVVGFRRLAVLCARGRRGAGNLSLRPADRAFVAGIRRAAPTTTLRPRPSVGPSVTFWVVVSTGIFFFQTFFFPVLSLPLSTLTNSFRTVFWCFFFSTPYVLVHRASAFPGRARARDRTATPADGGNRNNTVFRDRIPGSVRGGSGSVITVSGRFHPGKTSSR